MSYDELVEEWEEAAETNYNKANRMWDMGEKEKYMQYMMMSQTYERCAKQLQREMRRSDGLFTLDPSD